MQFLAVKLLRKLNTSPDSAHGGGFRRAFGEVSVRSTLAGMNPDLSADHKPSVTSL